MFRHTSLHQVGMFFNSETKYMNWLVANRTNLIIQCWGFMVYFLILLISSFRCSREGYVQKTFKKAIGPLLTIVATKVSTKDMEVTTKTGSWTIIFTSGKNNYLPVCAKQNNVGPNGRLTVGSDLSAAKLLLDCPALSCYPGGSNRMELELMNIW